MGGNAHALTSVPDSNIDSNTSNNSFSSNYIDINDSINISTYSNSNLSINNFNNELSITYGKNSNTTVIILVL